MVFKWVVVGKVTPKKAMSNSLWWRFRIHMWKLLQVRGVGGPGLALGARAAGCLPAGPACHLGRSRAATPPGSPALPLTHTLPMLPPMLAAQDLPIYRTGSDPWTGTELFNAFMRCLGARVGRQCWLGERMSCHEPDMLSMGDYVSVCSAVTFSAVSGAQWVACWSNQRAVWLWLWWG